MTKPELSDKENEACMVLVEHGWKIAMRPFIEDIDYLAGECGADAEEGRYAMAICKPKLPCI